MMLRVRLWLRLRVSLSLMVMMRVMTRGASHGVPIVGPPSLGGPRNFSLLSKFTQHVAVAIWYNINNVSVLILLTFYLILLIQ